MPADVATAVPDETETEEEPLEPEEPPPVEGLPDGAV